MESSFFGVSFGRRRWQGFNGRDNVIEVKTVEALFLVSRRHSCCDWVIKVIVFPACFIADDIDSSGRRSEMCRPGIPYRVGQRRGVLRRHNTESMGMISAEVRNSEEG